MPDAAPATETFWAAGDLEKVERCAACGATTLLPVYRGVEDGEEGIPGKFDFVGCAACGSLLLDPRPTERAIPKAYASYYTHQSAAEENARYDGRSLLWRAANGYLSRRYGAHREHRLAAGAGLIPLIWPLRQQLDYLFRHLPRTPGRLLDVGCGNGAFLLRARTAGWDVAGVEPDPSAAARARADGLVVHAGSLDTFDNNEQWDYITLSHVIEHVHDPGRLLGQIRERLRPGGCLWIATPNIAGTGRRLFGAHWQALETPRHLVMPAPRALAALLRDAGYSDVRFRRRGRGSRKRIDVSNARAVAAGRPSHHALLWSQWVDLRASFDAYAAEELVVTAIAPGAR